MKALVYFIGFAVFARVSSDHQGPKIIATKGEIWPKPQEQNKSSNYLILKPELFQFKLQTKYDCQTLRRALLRYEIIINSHYERVAKNLQRKNHVVYKKTWLGNDDFAGYLLSLDVYLNGPCNDDDYPFQDMAEAYTIEISNKSANLHSESLWGILRGLETFSQSFYMTDDGFSLRINLTSISDYPRFPHRGLMLDTARHYISVKKILATLDAMAYNKLNVFHWHIVDDQSFPYVSQKYPEMSEKGAYRPYLIYSVSDVKLIIEYARERGIRVIPEFDTPGHTMSWGGSHRELLTECYSDTHKNGELGPMDPSKESTYKFLAEFFNEVDGTFADKFIHLGGDEVDFTCWSTNPDIKKFMVTKKIDTLENLESYYIQRLINMADKLNASTIVWEEVFSNGVVLPNQTIVHVWRESSWELVIHNVTKSGKHALLSACWYLDHIKIGGDWEDFYNCEPFDFAGNEEQFEKILGGEACMWSEVVDDSNVMSRVWPRASAPAERLWSDKSVVDIADAERRIEEHYCRLRRRGINAQPPNGPGFCA